MTKETIVAVIRKDIVRQASDLSWEYVNTNGDDDTVTLDGDFNLAEIADAILREAAS